MSACIAMAVCAMRWASVASPAVFHVITRMLVSVWAGSAPGPTPRETRMPAFTPPATSAMTAIEPAKARVRRLRHAMSASTSTAPNTSTTTPRSDTIWANG